MVLGAPIGVTPGSVLFGGAGGVLAQDNANFNFNDATNNLTLGGQLLTSDGSALTPAQSFASDPASGMWLGGGALRFAFNTNTTLVIDGTNITLVGTNLFIGGAQDVPLTRDAAGTLAQKNGANAQTLRVYGTTVGNVYLSLAHDGTDAVISASSGQLTFGNKIFPSTDAAAKQTVAGIYAGNGVPNNANGANGDFYFRGDGAAGTFVYHRAGGAWTAFA